MGIITVSCRAVRSIKWVHVHKVLQTVPKTEQALEKCWLLFLLKGLRLGESRLEVRLVNAQVALTPLLNTRDPPILA